MVKCCFQLASAWALFLIGNHHLSITNTTPIVQSLIAMRALTLQDGQAGLPSLNSTSSYWHKEPSNVLLGHRTTPDLPPETDIVVIGSGITGAFVARELVAARRGVVMLESREACWGATGRVSPSPLPRPIAHMPRSVLD